MNSFVSIRKGTDMLLRQSSFVPCPNESNMRLKQWEKGVVLSLPHGGGPTPHSTLSEAGRSTGRACFKRILVSEYFIAIRGDRKSTRLNSSHSSISYAVF